MNRQSLDRDWEFERSKTNASADSQNQKKLVQLPHDFTIETDTYPEAPAGAASGYYGGGAGIYTKMLHIPAEAADQRVLVEFDGAYMNATVILNGHKVTEHHYGYTPFHADLTPYIKPGKPNRLTVVVNNDAQPNSRWYSGSGLYRHVDLLTAPLLHIAPWGIYARTSHIVGGTAFVIVETTVENHTGKPAHVWVNIRMDRESDGETAGAGRVRIHVPAGGKRTGRVTVPVDDVRLWDIDSPNLYRITADLSDESGCLDRDTVTFGVRTISVDVKNGFMLNGRTLKLKGGNVHHDNGILGAAAFRDSEYRKMKLLKDNGYNAVRCAHNPPSRDLLDACDRLGLLVINEAFDMWTMEKKTHDYSLYFKSDWKADMEAFILRDRNHPSVIMWSTGNEVNERGGLSGGYQWAWELAEWVRKLDPTRPVTNGLCTFYTGLEDEDQARYYEEVFENPDMAGFINFDTPFGEKIWGEYTEAFCAPLDVVGYNYLMHQYEATGAAFPNRVICSTESIARDMDKYWESVERYPYLIGDFAWTAFDYIGEAGLGKAVYAEPGTEDELRKTTGESPFPWRLANCADFDLCGFARPQLAYRRIVWGSRETYIVSRHPEHYGKTEILSGWGWPECDHAWSWKGHEGKPVLVEVYSAADEVELFLNGRSVGRKPAGPGNRFKARFDLIYEPGTLEAVGYSAAGERLSSDAVSTAGEPAGIRLTPEKRELAADGQSLCYVVAEIVDGEGNRVPNAEIPAVAEVKGAGTLAAFGAGRPQTMENYTAGRFVSCKGRLLAIVRAGYEAGLAALTVNAEGLGSASLEIPVKA